LSLLEVTLLGFLAGTLGTGAGGVLAILLTRVSSRQLSTLLGFSAGIMLAVVSFELMPEALNVGGVALGSAGLVLGAVLMAGIDILLPHWHLHGERERSKYIRTGVILGLGIAMHNLPEGLAIGGGGIQGAQLGMALVVTIFIQNVPEGLAMALPLNFGKIKPAKTLLLTMAVGLPMGLGAAVGGLVGRVSPTFLCLALAFAAGAMLFITCDEMIPQAEELSCGHSATFGIVVGVIAGILISSLFTG